LTFKAGVLFLVAGAGIIFYFREERSRLDRKKVAEQTKGIGKPKVGGPFDLIDDEGKPFTDRDMRGKYSLVCFPLWGGWPMELDWLADESRSISASRTALISAPMSSIKWLK
jgi:protein SCO1